MTYIGPKRIGVIRHYSIWMIDMNFYQSKKPNLDDQVARKNVNISYQCIIRNEIYWA